MVGFLVSGGDRKEKEEDLIFRGGLFGLKKENVRKGCKRKGSRELKKRREGFVGGHRRALSVFLFSLDGGTLWLLKVVCPL